MIIIICANAHMQGYFGFPETVRKNTGRVDENVLKATLLESVF